MTIRSVDLGSLKGILRYDDTKHDAIGISGISDNQVLLTGGGVGKFNPSQVGGGGGGVGDVSGPGAGTTAMAVCVFANTLGTDIEQNKIGSDPVQINSANELLKVSGINPSTEEDVIINRTRIGPIDNPDHMVLSHEDNHTAVSFSIAQSNLGRTLLNTAAGQNMSFSVGGVEGARMSTARNWEFSDGTEAFPGLAFLGDTNTGIYSDGTDLLSVATGGGRRLQLGATGIRVGVLGSAGSPSISWTGDPDTGIFQNGGNIIGFSCGGSVQMNINSTGNVDPGTNFGSSLGSSGKRWNQLNVNSALFGNGSAAQPSLSLNSDPNSGIFGEGSDIIGISTGGVRRFQIRSSGVRLGVGGSPGNPSISQTNDSNTGIYWPGADQLGFATGGVLRVHVTSTQAIFTGDVQAGKYLRNVQGANLTITSNAITITQSSHIVTTTSSLDTINGGIGNGTHLFLLVGLFNVVTVRHNVGNVLNNTTANIVFTGLENINSQKAAGLWFVTNGTNP